MPLRIPPWARPRLGRLPGDPEPEQALAVPGPVEDAPPSAPDRSPSLRELVERGEITQEEAQRRLDALFAPSMTEAVPEYTAPPVDEDVRPEPGLPEGVLGYGVGLWVDGEFLGFTHVTALSRESAEDEVRCWQRERRVCRVVEVRLP